jgi:hypothetical protein
LVLVSLVVLVVLVVLVDEPASWPVPISSASPS